MKRLIKVYITQDKATCEGIQDKATCECIQYKKAASEGIQYKIKNL